MNIYLLTLSERDPASQWVDIAEGFVVLATSRKAAREIASLRAGDEGASCWLDDERTTCAAIGRGDPGSSSGIVLRSFRAG